MKSKKLTGRWYADWKKELPELSYVISLNGSRSSGKKKLPPYIFLDGKKVSKKELEENFKQAMERPLEPWLIELCKRLGDK